MKQFLSFILLLISVSVYSDDFVGWKEIKTDHLRFIFEERDGETANELALYGEDIYEIVTEFFDFHPKMINIYINGRIDTPNGFFYPIPGSINLYPAFPLNSENTTKSKSWLFELLLHEMVHYVSLENRKGFFGVLSYLFGKDLAAANGAFMPAWLVEGIAVYLESKYTEGGRGRNLYFEASNRAAAIEQNYPNIYQLAYSSDFPPYNRIYSVGYLFTDFLLKTYGDDLFHRVYLRYVKFPFFGPFHAFKKETGKSIKDLYKILQEKEIKKYESRNALAAEFPSIKISESAYSSWTHPVLTDKGIMVYRRAQNQKSSIVLIDEETEIETEIINVELLDGSSFNSDSTGNIVVFSKADYSLYHMYGYSIISNIYIYENGKIRLLSEDKSLFQPAISRDGESIIAVQRVGSYTRLVSVDKNNGEISVLFEKDNTNIMNPAFSPSSDKIAFVLNDHGFQDIYTMDRTDVTSAQPLLTIDKYSEYFPRFLNEEVISFISDRGGDLSLFSYNLTEKQLYLRFKDPVGVADAFISEENIYYQSYRTDGYELRRGEIVPSEQYAYSDGTRPPETADKNPSYTAKKYIDWTLPYLWLPKPELKITATEGIQPGIGAAVWAGSFGQSGEWVLGFNYTPGLGQINGSFDYTQKLGTTTLGYSFLQSYDELYNGVDYSWRQSTQQKLQWIIPIYENSRLNWRNVLKTYFSFSHKLQLSAPNTFTFSDSFSMATENYLYSSAGLIFNGFGINYPRKFLFGETSISNRIDFAFLLPLLSSDITVFVIKDSTRLAFPLGPKGFLMQMGLEGAYHNRKLSSSALSARGWTSTYISSDISLKYDLSYMMPIALVDWGMPFGFNIQNIAMAIHFEGISNFTFSGSSYNEIFCGLEFIGTYGYNYGSIPIGAGINFRLYKQGNPFNPSEDIKVYFFFSFNSLN